MLIYTCNQRAWKAGAEDHYKFEDSQVYRAEPVSKINIQIMQNCQVPGATGMGVVGQDLRPQLAHGGPCWLRNMQIRDSHKPCASVRPFRVEWGPWKESPTASSVRWILIRHLLSSHWKWSAGCHWPIHHLPAANRVAIFHLPHKGGLLLKRRCHDQHRHGFLAHLVIHSPKVHGHVFITKHKLQNQLSSK